MSGEGLGVVDDDQVGEQLRQLLGLCDEHLRPLEADVVGHHAPPAGWAFACVGGGMGPHSPRSAQDPKGGGAQLRTHPPTQLGSWSQASEDLLICLWTLKNF